MVSEWPYDAKKSTSLWLCGFLGFTGAHNFYLGRFIKGLIMLIGLLIALTLVILSDYGYSPNTGFSYYLRIIGVIPGASVLIFWISDFLSIFLERYKIPVSIDGNLYDLKSEVLKDKKNKNKKLTKNNRKIKKNTEKIEIINKINKEKQ
jgi:TM2 domain-containing membrane protein YozV